MRDCKVNCHASFNMATTSREYSPFTASSTLPPTFTTGSLSTKIYLMSKRTSYAYISKLLSVYRNSKYGVNSKEKLLAI